VDIFREYEKDVELRRRFEEAASTELQQGWDRGSKKSSAELMREGEVQELLDRPRVMEEGRSLGQILRKRHSSEQQSPKSEVTRPSDTGVGGNASSRPSMDIHELLSNRFGSVKRA
jgi:phospholipid-translocating ATPase